MMMMLTLLYDLEVLLFNKKCSIFDIKNIDCFINGILRMYRGRYLKMIRCDLKKQYRITDNFFQPIHQFDSFYDLHPQ